MHQIKALEKKQNVRYMRNNNSYPQNQETKFYLEKLGSKKIIKIGNLKFVENNNLNVLIGSVSTKREIDGLAMSTRNKYLGNKERQKAPLFYQQLSNAKAAIEQGDSIEFIMEKTLSELSVYFEVEYLEILNANNLTQIATNTSEIIIISAIRLGETRLIDNIVFRRPNV